MSTEGAVKDAGKPVTGPFEKTKGWLDWYEGPSKPSFSLPPGAVDAHCHVFGPGAEFPYAPERKYTPCDASKAQLFALRDRLGFDRNVIVQATCHGADNSAMVDALLLSDGRARGVATVRRDVTDAELKRLACGGRARRALQFHQASGRLHAEGRAERDHRAHHRARLAYRRLFRGGGLGRSRGFFLRAANDDRCRPHGPARRDEAGRRSGIRALPQIHGRLRERLVQGDRRRAPVGFRSAGAERRDERLPRRHSVRAQGGRGISGSRACGAPTGRIRT